MKRWIVCKKQSWTFPSITPTLRNNRSDSPRKCRGTSSPKWRIEKNEVGSDERRNKKTRTIIYDHQRWKSPAIHIRRLPPPRQTKAFPIEMHPKSRTRAVARTRSLTRAPLPSASKERGSPTRHSQEWERATRTKGARTTQDLGAQIQQQKLLPSISATRYQFQSIGVITEHRVMPTLHHGDPIVPPFFREMAAFEDRIPTF